jgi:CBS domain-containing protein
MQLPYRTLKQILAAKSSEVISASPDTTVFSALKMMAAKNVGFLVVLEREKLVGVVSERDYARKVVLEGKASANTPVRDIMTEKVVSVTVDQTVPQCMALMDKGGFRHLPILEGNKVIGVLSSRDLLKEVVSHHEHLIRDLERDRLEILHPDPSSY